METVKVNVNVDRDTKEASERLFKALGLNMSAAVNMFLKRALLERGIPFSVDLNIPNAETMAALRAAEEGKDVHGPFNNVDELMESLNAED